MGRAPFAAAWLAAIAAACDAGAGNGGAAGFDFCQELHWGMAGNATVCSDLQVDTSGCVRVGCPWHRFSVTSGGGDLYSAPSRDLSLSYSTGAPAKWTQPILAPDGALYAAPMSAESVLRLAEGAELGFGGSAEVSEIQPSESIAGGFAKFGSVVLGQDGFVYAIPYSASQVMRINLALAAEGNSSALEFFGDVGTDGYKWLHGVTSGGQIYAVPAGASTVLAIDIAALSVAQLAIGSTLASSLQNFLHSVVSPRTGDIFAVPADATFALHIRHSTQEVLTLGNFSEDSLKWMHGVVGIDGQIYCMPGSATAILRIHPGASGADATVELMDGGGLLDSTERKWSQGVLGPDGRIFGVPHGAAQVLVIDTSNDQVSLIGPLLSGGLYKWHSGVLALDGAIYVAPYDTERVLRINASADLVEEVLEGFAMAGEHQYSGLALTPSGAMYGFPAYNADILALQSSRDLCLGGPALQDVSCSLGLHCSVELSPLDLVLPSALNDGDAHGVLWVALDAACEEVLAVVGFTNPQPDSSAGASASNRSYALGTALTGAVSLDHALCWAPFWGSKDLTRLGQFQLRGPRQDFDGRCTLGLPCLVVLQGAGLGYGALVLAQLNDTASTALDHCAEAVPAEFLGFGNSYFEANESDTNQSFLLGTATNGSAGGYHLCWSPGPSDPFRTSVGSLIVEGPYLSTALLSLQCWVGFECLILVSGLNLASANRLTLGEASFPCENRSGEVPAIFLAGLSNPALAGSEDNATYLLGTPLAAHPQRLLVCWHATGEATGISYASLMIYGPMTGLEIGCRLNETCNVSLADDSIVGSLDDGFSLDNRLLLVKNTSCTSASASASVWGIAQPIAPSNASNLSALFFDLLRPVAQDLAETEEVVGTYALCLSLGGNFSMALGNLTVSDAPCAAPSNIAGALAPPCLDAAGAPVAVLRHGENCTTACEDEFTESLPLLQCGYGELSPASFDCWPRCMEAPQVYNGLSHDFCAGLPHGSLCNLQCPADFVASGFLSCVFGRYVHQPLLAFEFLFGVPRCYASCDASGACGAGYERMLHGESCRARCASGTPDVFEVTCRDGAIESFECLAGCTEGPGVLHSVNDADCQGAGHGTVCTLRCEVGYAKTGDPECHRGVWSVETCLAPCDMPQVPQANISCEGLAPGERVPHLGLCEPSCNGAFLPELLDGSSTLRCFDGALSPASFRCRAPCDTKPAVAFADQAMLEACVGTLHNASCELKCLGGRTKTADLHCQDGSFSDAACIQLCNSPPSVANAHPATGCTARPSGATCTISCLEGFSSQTAVSVCQDGAWSPVRCDKECAALEVEDALSPSCLEGSAVPSGGFCSPRCIDGLQPDEAQLRCAVGVLQPSTFSCSRTCGAVAIENAASTDCEGMQYKKVCPLLCLAGFFATADLYCGAQGWQDIANASTLPRCLQVRCAGPLPAVPGADESDGSHGCGQAVGANCSDVTCPPGSVLSGHFQCGALGLWEAVGDVRCVEQQCPALSPLSTVCGDRALGATCPLSCPPGYSSAGFRCVGGTWQPLAEPVECTPGACRGVPSLMNALEPEACRNLPSGQTCAGACVAPWVPWGVFRCESMRWVEVPLCLPQTDGGDLVEAIAMSALLEPDTEVTAYTLEDWAVLAEDALELALQRQLAQQVPATLPLTVKATGRLAELGGRRLQELKPATWRLEYQVMIIPSAAATEALAALPQLPLATAVLQVLPPPRPALRLTTSQRLAPLPRSAATALAAEALVLTTTTTTTTQLSYVSEISRETQNTTQTSEEPEVGLDERLVALLVLLPVGCVLGFCVSRRLRRFFTSSHEVTTEAEKVDFQFVLKEEQLGEDAAENQVSISQVKHHARMRSMESQRDDLHQTMTATIMAKAAAEVEAERAAGDSQAMAMARSSEKQLPEFDRAMEALQDPQAYMAQMGTSHEPERIEKVKLSRREKRAVLRMALGAFLAEAWYGLVEALPCGCCRRRCRCCRRPVHTTPGRRRREAEEQEEECPSSPSEYSEPPEPPVTRASGRMSLSSCDDATAAADGMHRGLDVEQVQAIREFWNFAGAEELVAEYAEKRPYHAQRFEEGDPSLAARYLCTPSAGNEVKEKVSELRLYGDEEKSEIHTLKFRPPARSALKPSLRLSTEGTPSSEAEEEAEGDGEPEEIDESGSESMGSESSDESSSESGPGESGQPVPESLGATAMEMEVLADLQELPSIPPPDADQLRAALDRAKRSPLYGDGARAKRMMPSMSQGALTTSQFFRSKSTVLGASRSEWSGGFGGTKSWAALRKAQALESLIAEVRSLAGDAPVKGDGNNDLPPKNSHEALLIRLKSRAARLEAEKHRDFISNYWNTMRSDEDSSAQDAHLDGLLEALDKRAEELKQRSEELQHEAKEAERRLEHVNSLNLGRATDHELQAMNAFERSQRRIQEDKKEEEYQKQRDEVQALFAKVHRRLQSELIELRDYKVLLREYRRLRLEKLSETLGKVQDGRRLRHCVRVMIRNGAQRILLRLESAQLPLEPWMREVLLNCCYVEIRIEDTDQKLLTLRRLALRPVHDEVQAMISKTKAERFENLFTRTLEMRHMPQAEEEKPLPEEFPTTGRKSAGGASTTSSFASERKGNQKEEEPDVPEKVKAEVRKLEEELSSLRRLLQDMRNNAAAVICNQLRQAEKSAGRNWSSKEAAAWGHRMLSLLVSEDFAKRTMKEWQKLAPTAMLTQ
ncbi:unnamed protein product [Effrenium voratum]|nr:unnamed protein product [Effrenium voratum]